MCIDCRRHPQHYDQHVVQDGRINQQLMYEMTREIQYQFKQIQFAVNPPISNKKDKSMSSVGNMMKRLLDKDAQVLVKVGYINGDLELTEKGKKALWAILFTANKADLVKEAKEELETEKETKE